MATHRKTLEHEERQRRQDRELFGLFDEWMSIPMPPGSVLPGRATALAVLAKWIKVVRNPAYLANDGERLSPAAKEFCGKFWPPLLKELKIQK